MKKAKTITVWFQNVMTGVPFARKAVQVEGPYVKYVDGSQSWNWHHLTREAALAASVTAIRTRIAEDAAFAERVRGVV